MDREKEDDIFFFPFINFLHIVRLHVEGACVGMRFYPIEMVYIQVPFVSIFSSVPLRVLSIACIEESSAMAHYLCLSSQKGRNDFRRENRGFSPCERH